MCVYEVCMHVLHDMCAVCSMCMPCVVCVCIMCMYVQCVCQHVSKYTHLYGNGAEEREKE